MHRTAANSQRHLWHARQPNVSNQQQDGAHTQLQMPSKKCNNNQQRRRRRRRGSGGHFAGIWCVSLAILICIALTNAAPNDSSAPTPTPSPPVSGSVSNLNQAKDAQQATATYGGSSSTESLPEPPQGQCLLDGLLVPETTAHCEKQTSCRAIQKTGHCCPDYKCDCEKDGRTYANGFKLVDPDTPCTVCYCKGGEIVCSSVTCFHRDDCKPKYVTGRCCPEYDNCPILDNNPPLLMESSSSSSTTSTAKPLPAVPMAGFNLNITIKEITKPTEIRITDDSKTKLAIPMPMRKAAANVAPDAAAAPSSTTTAATSTAASTTTITTTTVAAATTEAAASLTTPTATTFTTTRPTMPALALPASQNSNSLLLKPLANYNADALQPLDSADPKKVNIKREYTTEGPNELSSTRGYDDAEILGSGAAFIRNGFSDALVDNADVLPEPDIAGSDNIYHIISTTEGPYNNSSSSTEHPMSSVVTETAAVAAEGNSSSTQEPLVEPSTDAIGEGSSTAQPTQHLDAEEEVPPVESNPAYPSLPEDDFSLRDVNFPLVELEDIAEAEAKDEPRSIVSSGKKLQTDSGLDGSGAGSGDLELYSSTTSSGPEQLLEAAAAKHNRDMLAVPLMYSVEDNSDETRIQNASDLQLNRRPNDNETSGEVSLEPETLETLLGSASGSGSGSGELPMPQRQREYTTPRPARATAVDIDELGSGASEASSAVDPKDDAESLKLDESLEHGNNVADKATARAEKSFVERASVTTGEALGQRIERLYLHRVY